MRLGIDFGTTRTVVSLCDAGNHPVVHFEDAEGELQSGFPSVIAEHDGELEFGWEALARINSDGWKVVPSFKRLIGGRGIAPLSVGEQQLSPMEALTRFFLALRQALYTRSNLPRPLLEDQVLEAIVATPAHADSSQRFLTLEAFRKAGFTVVGMMNEPSAAGVEYASRYRSTFNSKREKILVYDLGGGTFDASLVDMAGERHDVIASAGLPRLGGDDFDQLLFDMVCEELGIEPKALSDAGRVRLRLHVREQKEALHPNSRRIVIEIGDVLPEVDLQAHLLEEDAAVMINVKAYYLRAEALIEQTLEAMSPLLNADDPMDGIAGVYMVGGASALPAVGRMLKARFGRRVHRSLNPTAATAVGLAQAFEENSHFQVRDRLSRSFGVFREAAGGERVVFDLLFDAGQMLPASGETVELARRYRPAHNIGHFRYVECSGLDDEGAPKGDVNLFAEIFFPYAPSLRTGDIDLSAMNISRLDAAGPLIEERYTIDAMGIIDFTITDLDSGDVRRHRFFSVEEE
ncbi:MAG: Hsp70 family protein [Myxococcota bacterium]